MRTKSALLSLLVVVAGVCVWLGLQQRERVAPAREGVGTDSTFPEAARHVVAIESGADQRAALSVQSVGTDSPEGRAEPATLRLRFQQQDGHAAQALAFSILPAGIEWSSEIVSPFSPRLEPCASGVSAADGSASVQLHDGNYQLDVAGGFYLVSDPSLVHTASRSEHLVLVARGPSLSGLVVDPWGQPVVGARVALGIGGGWFSSTLPAPPEDTRAHYRIAYTDELGAYRLDGIIAGNSVRVSAGAPSFAPAVTQPIRIEYGENRAPTLQLAAECIVVVRLEDPLGLLLSGDVVSLEPHDDFLLHLERRTPVAESREITFAGLAAGRYRAGVRTRTGYAARAEVESSTGATVAVSLSIQEPQRLSGVVVDASGFPIAGAHVWVTGDDQSESTDTDDDGRFGLPVSPGKLDVLVTAKGYVEDRRELELAERGVGDELRVVLARGASLTLVLSTGDRRVDRVRVESWFQRAGTFMSDQAAWELEVHADRIVVSGLASGRASGVVRDEVAGLIGVYDVELPAEIGPSGSFEASVDLVPCVSVSGFVMDSHGVPIAGAGLDVQYGPYAVDPSRFGLLVPSQVRTTVDGRFRIEGVHPTRATLLVSRRGFKSQTVELRALDPRSVLIELSPVSVISPLDRDSLRRMQTESSR